jgi:hypothetical protein
MSLAAISITPGHEIGCSGKIKRNVEKHGSRLSYLEIVACEA